MGFSFHRLVFLQSPSRWLYLVLVALSVSLILPPLSARAAVVEIQPLFFGQWIIPNNDLPYSITLTDTGILLPSPGFIEIQPATHGIFEISGLPDLEILSIDVTESIPLSSSGGPIMTMDNFTTRADDPVGGITILYIGARVTTTGDGVPYPDDTMMGTLTVDFNF